MARTRSEGQHRTDLGYRPSKVLVCIAINPGHGIPRQPRRDRLGSVKRGWVWHPLEAKEYRYAGARAEARDDDSAPESTVACARR